MAKHRSNPNPNPHPGPNPSPSLGFLTLTLMLTVAPNPSPNPNPTPNPDQSFTTPKLPNSNPNPTRGLVTILDLKPYPCSDSVSLHSSLTLALIPGACILAVVGIDQQVLSRVSAGPGLV